MSDPSSESIARLLPDVPRWVEVRGMLLAGYGRAEWVDAGPPPSFVAFDPDALAVVIGQPPDEVIRAAADRVREVLAAPENVDRVAALLADWKPEPAAIHVLHSDSRLPDVPDGSVREPSRAELEAVPEKELRQQLLSEVDAGTRIVAAYDAGVPAAFCYAASATEEWWDISIDTLETHRRQGHAARCVAFLIREMARLGKRPVWGAVESNVGSLGLAAKLGFRRVSTLYLLSR